MIVENYGDNKLMTFADLCIGDTFEIFNSDRYSSTLCIKTDYTDRIESNNAIYYDNNDKTWGTLTVRMHAEVKKIKSKLIIER